MVNIKAKCCCVALSPKEEKERARKLKQLRAKGKTPLKFRKGKWYIYTGRYNKEWDKDFEYKPTYADGLPVLCVWVDTFFEIGDKKQGVTFLCDVKETGSDLEDWSSSEHLIKFREIAAPTKKELLTIFQRWE